MFVNVRRPYNNRELLLPRQILHSLLPRYYSLYIVFIILHIEILYTCFKRNSRRTTGWKKDNIELGIKIVRLPIRLYLHIRSVNVFVEYLRLEARTNRKVGTHGDVG